MEKFCETQYKQDQGFCQNTKKDCILGIKGLRLNFGIKELWSILFTLAILVTLWVLATFVVKFIVYNRAKPSTFTEVFEWGVMEVEDDINFVVADYKFISLPEEEVVSQYVFERVKYRTKEAAEEAIAEMRQKEWTVHWYGSPTVPYSMLERQFPFKAAFHVLIAFFVAVYFFVMKRSSFAGAASEKKLSSS